jgi:Ser/Thr protein kinase RdoA (MazF antagonist)
MFTFLSSNIVHIPRPARLSAHLFASLRSLDIDVETVTEVLSHYDLKFIAPPQNLPNARRNQNLIIHTTSGKKIFKHYRLDWHPSTIIYEHSILKQLEEIGFPAPRLVMTTEGRTFIEKQGNYYAVFDHVDGRNYSMTFLLRSQRMKLIATAGQTLARLHKAMKGFVPKGHHHLGFKSYTKDRSRDLGWHVRKISELKEMSGILTDSTVYPHARLLIQHGHEILDELTLVDELLSDELLPRVIIHGDYGLHNLIFQDAGHVTPVDFELARLEWRLSDLVSCFSKLRRRNRSYDHESIRCFIAAYQKEYPVSDYEWLLFPQVWKYYKLMKVVQYWSSYFETHGPVRKLVSALDAFEQVSWATDQPQSFFNLG